VTTAAELGRHRPGEEEVLPAAELGADRDLHVEQQAVVEFVAFAVVAECAHGCLSSGRSWRLAALLRAYPSGIQVYRDRAIVFYIIPTERITA